MLLTGILGQMRIYVLVMKAKGVMQNCRLKIENSL